MDILWLGIALVILLIVRRGYRQFHRGQRRRRWLTRERMPAELVTATLFGSEQPIRCDDPVPLSGRYDQLYRCADGELLLVDSKRRHRAQVYESDIIPLSAYRTMLAHTRDRRYQHCTIKPYGYVRLV